MNAHDLPLEELLSPARYKKYQAAAQGDTARAARLYMWNCELSAAYWPSISLVEIAVRNAIDVQLCARLGVTREHGWHPEALDDKPRIHLTNKERDKIKKSIEVFDRKNNPAGQPNTVTPTGGDVVSGLSLGFWVALVGEGIPRGHGQIYDYFQKLWRPFLYQAFPNYGAAGRSSPGPIRNGLRKFELLRNRIAHHEPIYMLSPTFNLANIITIASWIDTDLSEYIREHEQVTTTINQYRPVVLQQQPA
jgi:hypothetical protein